VAAGADDAPDDERGVVVVVDGATAFEISCQYERHDAEMANGCDRIIDTFELAG